MKQMNKSPNKMVKSQVDSDFKYFENFFIIGQLDGTPQTFFNLKNLDPKQEFDYF